MQTTHHSSASSLNNQKQKLLILGLGRVGLDVAKAAIAHHNVETSSSSSSPSVLEVVGTVRRPLDEEEKKNKYNEDGIDRISFDPVSIQKHLSPPPDSDVTPVTHILFTIPLQRKEDPIQENILDQVQKWWTTRTDDDNDDNNNSNKILGFLSTTGVYGDHNGAVVTEDSPLLCQPESNANLYRQLEEDWINVAKNSTNTGDHDNCRRFLYIFRCAGIYDSSRSALHTVYQQGYNPPPSISDTNSSSSTQKKKNISLTNRIHSLDIARAVNAAFFSRNTKHDIDSTPCYRIYNLADNKPEARSVVLSYAKELLIGIGCDLPQPSSTESTTNPSRSSQTRQSRRQTERKLVSNERMKNELLLHDTGDDGDLLLYPTYKEGLKAILDDPSTPWQQNKKDKTA